MKTYNIPTTFKCPLVPFVPCVGIAINMYMLAGLKSAAWIRLGVWLVIGLLIYGLYGIWNSKMRDYISPSSSTPDLYTTSSMSPPAKDAVRSPFHSINNVITNKCAIN